MDPDQFRNIRLEINRLDKDIGLSIEKNDAEESNKVLDQAHALLEKLAAEAEGEIQLRSVKNLGYKLKSSLGLIGKIKPSKAASRRAASGEKIVWDEAQLALLSVNYLKKLVDNMKADTESTVRFSTTGKGIQPSYLIDFGKDKESFSGSKHSPLKRKLPQGQDRISKPFSFSEINTILDRKT